MQLLIIICSILAVILILVVVSSVQFAKRAKIMKETTEMLCAMSGMERLNYLLQTVDGAVITVGTIKDGKAEWTVYRSGGVELPKELHNYEIGSITKTVTATMIAKAVSEGLINIDETIDAYLDIPEDGVYPTIRQLLTHTSGYQRDYYTVSSYLKAIMSPTECFKGITREHLINVIKKSKISGEDAPWAYSNVGVTVLGMVLESVYHKNYIDMANDFLQDIGMTNSQISVGEGDFGGYFDWGDDNPYVACGGIMSNIEDMLVYAQLQLDNEGIFAMTHETLAEVKDAAPKEGIENMAKAGAIVDEMGMNWFKDSENGFIWHGGTTVNQRTYIGCCPETGTAVVVLSNLEKNPTIKVHPPMMVGAKLLKEMQE